MEQSPSHPDVVSGTTNLSPLNSGMLVVSSVLPSWSTDMSKAPRGRISKTTGIPIADYVLLFVPDNAPPHDVEAGICIGWWEPIHGQWCTEFSEDVLPTMWCSYPKLPEGTKGKYRDPLGDD